MYVYVVWGRLRLGMWPEYEKFYKERVSPSTQEVVGLRERKLMRSIQDPDEGLSISFWDTLQDLQNYERSDQRKELAQEADHLYQPLSYPRGEFWVKHFEVISTHQQ